MDGRTEWQARLRLVLPAAALFAVSPPCSASAAPPKQAGIAPAFRVLIPGRAADALRRRLAGARRRLDQRRCQSVLNEFSDEAGRPLAVRLGELGVTPQEYLERVLFEDGSALRPCASRKVLAVTNPGSPVIFICPEFGAVAHFDPVEAELILIHEVLHSLGLGEDPPSSVEITQRVEKRCRR